MFNNVAIDVVIGLVFIYLLYSLLATILAEMVATSIGLRAHNLREAVERMLSDDDEERQSLWNRFLNTFSIIKSAKSPTVKVFYNHPEIKYLGRTRLLTSPSNFKAYSFAKTLLYTLNGPGPIDLAVIRKQLQQIGSGANVDKDKKILDKNTAVYVLSLLNEANGDVEQFRLNLESWFDRTMEQALEWYKRKIQSILLVIGFAIAWSFGVDTIAITKKLATDKTTRERIVVLAEAYSNQPLSISKFSKDSVNVQDVKQLNARLDSLSVVKKKLDNDLNAVSEVLGMKDDKPFTNHFPGYILTAFAISLGAPFWFDLLNKIMRLRTAVKQGTQTAGKTPVEATSTTK